LWYFILQNEGFNLTFTGADGDGGRFRLPTDTPPVNGSCATHCNSASAVEWLCIHDDDCVGVYV